jgi:hypothetical protein
VFRVVEGGTHYQPDVPRGRRLQVSMPPAEDAREDPPAACSCRTTMTRTRRHLREAWHQPPRPGNSGKARRACSMSSSTCGQRYEPVDDREGSEPQTLAGQLPFAALRTTSSRYCQVPFSLTGRPSKLRHHRMKSLSATTTRPS